MNNIVDFGAVGDGVTDNTDAIQRAVDAGGVAFIPAGTFVSGTIYLRSNGGLELAPGAVLLGSPDPAKYNAADFCQQNRASVTEKASGAHLIVALECQNVVIRGEGIIDGNRPATNKVQNLRGVGTNEVAAHQFLIALNPEVLGQLGQSNGLVIVSRSQVVGGV